MAAAAAGPALELAKNPELNKTARVIIKDGLPVVGKTASSVVKTAGKTVGKVSGHVFSFGKTTVKAGIGGVVAILALPLIFIIIIIIVIVIAVESFEGPSIKERLTVNSIGDKIKTGAANVTQKAKKALSIK